MSSYFFTHDESAQIDTRSRHVGPDGRARVRTVLAMNPEQIAPGLGSPTPRRTEVTPPSLFARPPSGWRAWLTGFWYWLWDLDEPASSPAVPARMLAAVRQKFMQAIHDLQSADACRLRTHVERARSLRELWHLRADVFRTISTHRGQIEAQSRLDALDAHFPVRTTRRADDGRHGRPSHW